LRLLSTEAESKAESKTSTESKASASAASKPSKGIVLGSKRVAPRTSVQYEENQPPAEEKPTSKKSDSKTSK
jgi:hypothetical protein